jgi:hypothetical protein
MAIVFVVEHAAAFHHSEALSSERLKHVLRLLEVVLSKPIETMGLDRVKQSLEVAVPEIGPRKLRKWQECIARHGDVLLVVEVEEFDYIR